MKRRVFCLLVAVLLFPALTAAGAWKEADWSADLAVNPKTGGPAVYFSVVLEYDPLPERFDISISWALYAVQDGMEVPVESLASSSAQDSSVRRLYLMSPPLPVEPGGTYGAHLAVQDSANGLTYRRDFRYLSPLVVPIGLRLEGWDGSSGMDLTGIADEELEDLATLYAHVKTYQQTASEQSLEAFLTAPLPLTDAYPAVVLLVPTAGLSTNLGGAKGVTLTVGQVFTMYVVPSADAVSALRTQVTAFDQPILGAVYIGSGDLGILAGKRVFVDKTAWAVLQAASAEWSRRTK
jgi:hypothetical protein